MTFPKTFAHLSWALAGLLASQAMAADPAAPKTREQVRAETQEAIRTGEISDGGELGCKRNEVSPSQYPSKPAAPGKTREQVRAETREAMRSGQMSSGGEVGCAPQVSPPQQPGKTRAQVKAETREAIRKGEMPALGELGSPSPAAGAAPRKSP
jgi:hypothetical protein